MAAETKSINRGGKPYRLTVRQFLAMIREGVFPDDARVELVGGILLEHPRRSPGHNFSVSVLGNQLRGLLPGPWFVSEEKSLELGRSSRVGPDLAVIRGPHELYRARDPRVEDVGFLIEVADLTYLYDRGMKWRAYASANIPICWVVDLSKRQIEVYRDPHGRGKGASYRETATFGPDSEIPIVLGGREIGRIQVKEVLP